MKEKTRHGIPVNSWNGIKTLLLQTFFQRRIFIQGRRVENAAGPCEGFVTLFIGLTGLGFMVT